MQHVFGWWDYDAECKALVNRTTRQRLTLIAQPPSAIWNAASTTVQHRLLYEDDETRYPLTLTTRPHHDNPHIQEWLLDHSASADTWRRRGNAPGPPPFGLWHRADDSAVDALLCWPENAGLLRSQGVILTVSAGWFDGRWHDVLRREFTANHIDWKAKRQPAARVLERLDRSPPQRWQFHDAPNARQGAQLQGVEKLPNKRLYLPTGKLTGFEQDVPHLRRVDRAAVMFPTGLSSDFFRGEDYRVCMPVDYTDEDVLLRINCRTGYLSIDRRSATAWMFDLTHTLCLGLRDKARFDRHASHLMPGDLFATIPSETRITGWPTERPVPSYELATRLNAALINGWLNWTGSQQHMHETPEWLAHQSSAGRSIFGPDGMPLGRRPGVRIKGGYVAGVFTYQPEQTAWLAS